MITFGTKILHVYIIKHHQIYHCIFYFLSPDPKWIGGYSHPPVCRQKLVYSKTFISFEIFQLYLVGKYIGSRLSIIHPCFVCQHFQTSPLKPMDQLNSNFLWRLLIRMQERKFVKKVLVTLTKMVATSIYTTVWVVFH